MSFEKGKPPPPPFKVEWMVIPKPVAYSPSANTPAARRAVRYGMYRKGFLFCFHFIFIVSESELRVDCIYIGSSFCRVAEASRCHFRGTLYVA